MSHSTHPTPEDIPVLLTADDVFNHVATRNEPIRIEHLKGMTRAEAVGMVGQLASIRILPKSSMITERPRTTTSDADRVHRAEDPAQFRLIMKQSMSVILTAAQEKQV